MGDKKRWLASLSMASLLVLGVVGQALTEPPPLVKVLISFADQPGPAEWALVDSSGGVIEHSYWLTPMIAASVPESAVDSLRASSTVVAVEEDVTVQASEEVLPWGIDHIDAEVVHAYNRGRGVKVAIIDTGIDLDHPDLAVAGNVTFVAGTSDGDDDNGHGTMVAGVVAALENDIGVIGVAPEATLYAVKVLNKDGTGYISDVIAGVEWAVANGAQVINLSLGSYLRWPSAAQTAFDNAYQAGVLLVGAAGNSGSADGQGDNILYPARYDSILAVGATNEWDARASFSSTGSALELVAPGVDIRSTSPGGYATSSGTSLASPHVAGTAALFFASGLTSNVEVRERLCQTADDLGIEGWDSEYGWGLVDPGDAAPQLEVEPLDITPPSVSITASPNLLWPPNHQVVDVTLDWLALDDPGGSGLKSVAIAVTDEYGELEFAVQDLADAVVQLEAWREGSDSDGRVYTITITTTDEAGNQGMAQTTVIVPHDNHN